MRSRKYRLVTSLERGNNRLIRHALRVRVKVGGVWCAGTALVLPGDDPAARSRVQPFQWDAAIGRMMASLR
jgi:hypothetical protein